MVANGVGGEESSEGEESASSDDSGAASSLDEIYRAADYVREKRIARKQVPVAHRNRQHCELFSLVFLGRA